jgi:hypothetical protein
MQPQRGQKRAAAQSAAESVGEETPSNGRQRTALQHHDVTLHCSMAQQLLSRCNKTLIFKDE